MDRPERAGVPKAVRAQLPNGGMGAQTPTPHTEDQCVASSIGGAFSKVSVLLSSTAFYTYTHIITYIAHPGDKTSYI